MSERQKWWLEALFSAIADPVLAVDRRGLVAFANPSALHLTGRDASDARGLAISEMLHFRGGAPGGSFEDLFKRVEAGARAVDLDDARVVDRSGGEHPVYGTAAPVRDATGATAQLALVLREGKREQPPRVPAGHGHEALRRFIDGAPAAIAMFDREMCYLAASRRWLSDYRLEGLDIRGRSHYDVFPDIPDRWRVAHRRGLAGEFVQESNDCFERSDGSTQWLRWEIQPWHAAEGVVGGIIVFTEDVSESVKAEDLRRTSQGRYRALFEYAPHGIVIADSQSYYVDANPAMCSMLGYTHDELVGMHASQIVEESELPHIEPALRAIAQSTYHRAWRFRRKDGSRCDAEVTAATMPDGRLLGLIRDISEQRNAERENAALEAQLHRAQRMEFIGRLAGGVAHDFNNMLSVILGCADMALEQIDQIHPLHRELTQIREAAERSAKLTGQLLAFARRQTAHPTMLDLNERIADMLGMLRRLIGEDVDLVWKPHPRPGSVNMDPAQVDQILANLCVNARDAIPGAGTITIETSIESFDAAFCAENPDFLPGDYVLLAVSDDGIGMTAETLTSIFEPYFTTKHDGKGTGLGLSTVYGIVRQNEGFIHVESEPGRGTTFRVYLVCSDATGKPSRTQSSKPAAPKGHETILLVEDDVMILKVASRMLSTLGYQVLGASNPTEALSLAAEHRDTIELLITDVVMPTMTGRELATRLQSESSRIRVLFISGYTADVIGHHGVLHDGVMFLPKPFSMSELAAKVREALAARQG